MGGLLEGGGAKGMLASSQIIVGGGGAGAAPFATPPLFLRLCFVKFYQTTVSPRRVPFICLHIILTSYQFYYI